MSDRIHVNDIGTQIILTVLEDGAAYDISSATTLQIIIKKPDTTTLTKTASFFTDGTDGKMVYISVSGDFDVPGYYKIQGKVIIGGSTFYTTTSTFKVYCNL